MQENKEGSTAANEGKRKRRAGMTHQTLVGFFWTFSGVSVQAVLGIVILGWLARLLSPTDFGILAAALVVGSFSDIFSQIGIGPAIIQRSELAENHIRTGFTASVLFGLVVSTTIWLLTPLIASVFRMPTLEPVLRVFTLVFVIGSLSVVAESLLRRNLKFRSLASIEAATYVIGYGAVAITLAKLGFGVWSLVIGNLAKEVLKTIALLIVQPHAKLPLFDRQAFKDLVYFGGGFTVARVLHQFAVQGDNFVVGRWLGASALGVYERAFAVMKHPATVYAKIIDSVLFPSMAKLQDDPKRLGVAYRRGLALVTLIVLPLSASLCVLAPEVIELLLGRSWSGVVVPFQILAAGLIFRMASRISGSLVVARGAVYHAAWRQGVYAAGVVFGAWLGQHWGLSGVALSVVLAIGIYYFMIIQLSLSLISSLTWKDVLVVHLPGIWSAAIVGGQVWVIAVVLRLLHLPPLAVIIGTVAWVALSLIGLLHLKPELVLGHDASWMLQTLVDYLPGKARSVAAKTLNVKPSGRGRD